MYKSFANVYNDSKAAGTAPAAHLKYENGGQQNE